MSENKINNVRVYMKPRMNFLSQFIADMQILTFPFHIIARMVKQEVLEAVAVRIDMRLPAEARRSEVSENLQGAQSRLTLSHRHR